MHGPMKYVKGLGRPLSIWPLPGGHGGTEVIDVLARPTPFSARGEGTWTLNSPELGISLGVWTPKLGSEFEAISG